MRQSPLQRGFGSCRGNGAKYCYRWIFNSTSRAVDDRNSATCRCPRKTARWQSVQRLRRVLQRRPLSLESLVAGSPRRRLPGARLAGAGDALCVRADTARFTVPASLACSARSAWAAAGIALDCGGQRLRLRRCRRCCNDRSIKPQYDRRSARQSSGGAAIASATRLVHPRKQKSP